MVAQTAPAVRVAIGEEAGMAPGSISTGQMVAGTSAFPAFYLFSAVLLETCVCGKGGAQECQWSELMLVL